MKYHYQIVHTANYKEIHTDSRNFGTEKGDFGGFKTTKEAAEHCESEMKRYKLNDDWFIRTIPVAETVEEEDQLAGHAYPGHETWDDSPMEIKAINEACMEREHDDFHTEQGF